jgi:hypothetical protein
MTVKRIYEIFSKRFYDNRKHKDDELNGIVCELNGLERKHGRIRIEKRYNANIVGYLCAYSAGFDKPRLNGTLTIAGRYDGNGFWVREDNCLEKLPLFAAARFPDHINTWQTMSFIFKSADKHKEFLHDVSLGTLDQFLLKVLLWTSLTHLSHIRSLIGSDGRVYLNKLCLDTSRGETYTTKHLKRLKWNNSEELLLSQWEKVIALARTTDEHIEELTYGLYQIDEELNVFIQEDTGFGIIRRPKYVELNSEINTLKTLVRDYYINNLVCKLFEYELLK